MSRSRYELFQQAPSKMVGIAATGLFLQLVTVALGTQILGLTSSLLFCGMTGGVILLLPHLLLQVYLLHLQKKYPSEKAKNRIHVAQALVFCAYELLAMTIGAQILGQSAVQSLMVAAIGMGIMLAAVFVLNYLALGLHRLLSPNDVPVAGAAESSPRSLAAVDAEKNPFLEDVGLQPSPPRPGYSAK